MNNPMAIPVILIIILTLISGLADAEGFTHAESAWIGGKIIWLEAAKSLLGFGLGALCYILAIRFLKMIGVVSIEVQTLLWFSVAIIGVALISGKFIRWQILDQLVGICVICGIGWLLFRVGE